MYKRKEELVNDIFKQTVNSCQSAALKSVYEFQYFKKYEEELDLDYYKFYKRISAVYGRGITTDKINFALDLMQDEGMYCKNTKKYYKIKKWRLFYSCRNRLMIGRNPFSAIIKGTPLILDCAWENKKLSEIAKNGDLNFNDRTTHHAMAGICGDEYNVDVIWVANSHGVDATGTDKGWFRFERKDDKSYAPLILAAYEISI